MFLSHSLRFFSKIEITTFGNHKTDVKRHQFFFCDGKELEIVHKFKYRGIKFNYNASFKIPLKDFVNRHLELFALLSNCRKFDVPIEVRLELFDRLVTSIMLYTCEYGGVERTTNSQKPQKGQKDDSVVYLVVFQSCLFRRNKQTTI